MRIERAEQLDLHPVGGELGVAAGALRRFEVVGHGALLGEYAGVVVREAEGIAKAPPPRQRQLRQCGAHGLDVRFAHHHRQQVRFREVAVVVGDFFAAHGAGRIPIRVVEPGFLPDRAALVEQVGLPRAFGADRFIDKAKGVEVLNLGARTQCVASAFAQ